MQLSVAQGDGASLRRHLEAAARHGEVDSRLEESRVLLPMPVRELYHAFLDVSATRHDGAPLTHLALEAWERRAGVRLSRWEADTFFAMDQAALAAVPAQGPAA